MTLRKKQYEQSGDLHAATAHLSDASLEVKKQVLAASDELVDCIKKKPVQSVLIASFIGILIGKFLL